MLGGRESRQPLWCMIRGAERMMRGITTDTETEKCDMSVCVGMSVSDSHRCGYKKARGKRQGPRPKDRLINNNKLNNK